MVAALTAVWSETMDWKMHSEGIVIDQRGVLKNQKEDESNEYLRRNPRVSFLFRIDNYKPYDT